MLHTKIYYFIQLDTFLIHIQVIFGAISYELAGFRKHFFQKFKIVDSLILPNFAHNELSSYHKYGDRLMEDNKIINRGHRMTGPIKKGLIR